MNEIPYTVEQAYLTPPEPDERVNKILWEIRDLEKECIEIRSEYEEMIEDMRHKNYIDFDLRESVFTGYENKIEIRKQIVAEMKQHLSEMGVEV